MEDARIEELMRRMDALEKENKALHEWTDGIQGILQEFADMLENQGKSLDQTLWNVRINRWRVDSLRYELRDPDYVPAVFKPHILSVEETRRQIIDERKSIGRLGDGELALISGVQRWNFQRADAAIGERLKQVLQSDEDGFLVGLNPNFYGNLEDLSDSDADGVRSYMTPDVRKQQASWLNREQTYGNLLIHRMDHPEDLEGIRRLWEGRECVFVEGEYTRMGVGNDLFDKAGDIVRILCPAESAFDRYDDIMNAVLKQSKDKLILLALGPTATVLAYDLYKEGYHAVDIGHIDLVYEKYRAGSKSLADVKIAYKYCNMDETGDGRKIEEINDPVYAGQIVERITV